MQNLSWPSWIDAKAQPQRDRHRCRPALVLWLLTLPLVLARFHVFSLVALVMNAVALAADVGVPDEWIWRADVRHDLSAAGKPLRLAVRRELLAA